MIRNALVIALGSFLALAAGCSKETDKESEKQAAPEASGQKEAAQEHPEHMEETHASKGAVPGSHEDWCGEHQVPESQCTRCNPDLIAAFKATGDWCEEHGLPESQCLKCNPELKIVRPPPGSGTKGN
jgi:hypothetical protein